MTNSERVVTLFRKAVEPPGDALPDWQLLCRARARARVRRALRVAERQRGVRRVSQAYRAERPAICRESRTPASRTGRCSGRVRARTTRARSAATRSGSRPRSGRARFVADQPKPPAEPPSREFPLVLTTGPAQAALAHAHPHALVAQPREPRSRADPRDPPDRRAAGSGVVDGGFAEVRSRRGEVVSQVRVTPEIVAGHRLPAVPLDAARTGLEKPANNLTHGAVDPISKQPELKHCAVRVRALPHARGARMSGRRLVMVGNGMAGLACLDAILAREPVVAGDGVRRRAAPRLQPHPALDAARRRMQHRETITHDAPGTRRAASRCAPAYASSRSTANAAACATTRAPRRPTTACCSRPAPRPRSRRSRAGSARASTCSARSTTPTRSSPRRSARDARS